MKFPPTKNKNKKKHFHSTDFLLFYDAAKRHNLVVLLGFQCSDLYVRFGQNKTVNMKIIIIINELITLGSYTGASQ